MDALEFLKAYAKMCHSYKEACKGCPLKGKVCALSSGYCNYEEVIFLVEQWAKEHPAKTRQSEFLKQFPDALLDENGVIDISPCIVSRGFRVDCSNRDTSCPSCRRAYWMQIDEQEISPEAQYAITKYADSIIERLDRLLQKTDDDIIQSLEHPCANCDSGWGTISEQGCTSCAESCERFKQYNRSQSRNV